MQWTFMEAFRLLTLRLTTATYSSRCLEAFHCSSVVSGQSGRGQTDLTGATQLYLSSIIQYIDICARALDCDPLDASKQSNDQSEDRILQINQSKNVSKYS